MSLGFAHFLACAALAAVGLHGMVFRPNLLRKLMGLNILQVSVIAFYLLLAFKRGAHPPILDGGAAEAGRFMNPLPHALMLTAIVVGVSTTGLALALVIRIHRLFGTLSEPEIAEALREP